ncbi:MAG TPA: hypothetical protein VF815_30940, partial [Myxococcaceae bacterium]
MRVIVTTALLVLMSVSCGGSCVSKMSGEHSAPYITPQSFPFAQTPSDHVACVLIRDPTNELECQLEITIPRDTPNDNVANAQFAAGCALKEAATKLDKASLPQQPTEQERFKQDCDY